MNSATSVIFVDDEEHIRISNRQTLELAGYGVSCFERADARKWRRVTTNAANTSTSLRK